MPVGSRLAPSFLCPVLHSVGYGSSCDRFLFFCGVQHLVCQLPSRLWNTTARVPDFSVCGIQQLVCQSLLPLLDTAARVSASSSSVEYSSSCASSRFFYGMQQIMCQSLLPLLVAAAPVPTSSSGMGVPAHVPVFASSVEYSSACVSFRFFCGYSSSCASFLILHGCSSSCASRCCLCWIQLLLPAPNDQLLNT